jgi:hypothetical protein
MLRKAIVVFLTFAAAAHEATANEANGLPPDQVPGTIIAHSPASSGIYVGSAGILKLSSGDYLAKHDEFGPGSTEYVSAVTRVYRSIDHGNTWRQVAKIDGLFWSNIFEHRGKVFMIGTHHHHGALVVVKSSDGGATWSTPRDGKSGLIRAGEWHTAPVPVVEHKGRLWRAVEDGDGPGGWGEMYRPRVMSIAVDGDLLDAQQWLITDPIARDDGWLGGTFWCVLEGNTVVDRLGVLRNVLRSDRDDLAAVATVSADGKELSIDPTFDRSALPGSSKKVLVRWDEPSKRYWALSNPASPEIKGRETSKVRNTLAVFTSSDLRQWAKRAVLLHHPDPVNHAFQYPDWVIDGDDMLVASRTAYDDGLGGAARAHDANYLTFHRVRHFRQLAEGSR